MRRLLTAAVLVALAAGPALAGQGGEERYYGPDGEYRGRVMTDDNGDAKVYDQHGRYLGRASGGQVPDKPKP